MRAAKPKGRDPKRAERKEIAWWTILVRRQNAGGGERRTPPASGKRGRLTDYVWFISLILFFLTLRKLQRQ